MWITCMTCGDVNSMFDESCDNCDDIREIENEEQKMPLDNLPKTIDIDAYTEGYNNPKRINPFMPESQEHTSFNYGQQMRWKNGK